MTSKAPSGGIYTTARSSDVFNIPTNSHFFLYFYSECVIEPQQH